MEADFSVQTLAFNSEQQQQQSHNNLPSNGAFEPFYNLDNSADNEIQPHQSHSSAGKLFVGGIAWETSEEAFGNYFGKYGEVVDSILMMDKLSGRPRGFGFVTFADSAVADIVLEQEHVIDGRMVEVKRTVPREDMPQKGVSRSKKIFVGGIPPTLSEDELKEYFSFYGNTIENQIMFDHNTGRSRGFGFVTFENEEDVEKVLSVGKNHELGGKQVEIKRAVPKRAGVGDYGSESKAYHRGGYASSKSYESSFNNRGSGREKGGYNENMLANGGGFGNFVGYGNYWGGGGGYGGAAAGGGGGGFYGGYGYGFGYGGSAMYNNAGGVYGGSGYGIPMMGYNGASVYGGRAGGGGGGFGNGDAAAASGAGGRYHPYRK